MSNLEDLVPALELCKQIPEGKFADSALVWHIELCSLDPAHVSQRFSPAICAVMYPAPTLQEILSCIDAIIDVSVHFHHRGEFRFVWAKKLSNGQLVTQDNPATAALKLWLKEQNNKNEKGN